MAMVYLARPLWHLISRYADRTGCVKCDAPAQYVQAVVSSGRGGKAVSGHFRRASAYCAEHIGAVSNRRQIPMVDSDSELLEIVQREREAIEAEY